ncbi:MAG: DEAD/DEAH box helicase [Ferribacterium limneticum]
MRDLPQWLLANAGFNKQLKHLTVDSVARQFEAVRKAEEFSNLEEFDLSYLMTCASILAHSSDGRCQDAALRIAQYCLSSQNTLAHKRDGAALILDALANRTAIKLAERRNFLELGYEERLPPNAQLDSTKRRFRYTIDLADNTKFIANKFQAAFWEELESNTWVSASAPTSVGKSFVLEAWIHDYLIRNDKNTVVYLVPTRALISQVERDLSLRLDPNKIGAINIASLPLSKSYDPSKANVFVFTQERLHIFLNSFEAPPVIDLLVVDEAHKIGDGHRGVFLQQVIEQICVENSNVKTIFASPFTENPELLLEDGPQGKSKSIKSFDITVNQNIIWVSQKPRHPKDWNISLCFQDIIVPIGDFSLENTPSPESKRLPFVAVALSKGKPGNIIYVNGAADAEKTARQVYDCLDDNELDSEVIDLIDLCEKTIHKNFLLNKMLKRGVAFHYGNMPLLVKSEIERLFSLNKISYLICTSTLVEGVNMSCRNIFVRGPKKGTHALMNSEDFWNLAGRAGRWGKEFQGNVICVDTDHEELWIDGIAPKSKAGVKISRTTDEIIGNSSNLLDYIQSEDHFNISSKNPQLEHVFSYLSIAYIEYGSLGDNPFLRRQSSAAIEKLNAAVKFVLDGLSFPQSVIKRNPGISPLLMEELFLRFGRDPNKPPERLLLAEPSSNDALDSYVSAFTRISDHLSPRLGFSSKQAYIRALLVVRWMRGFPLARLISERISYLRKKLSSDTDANIIRSVMKDVEEIARYQAPRLLSCYNDLLAHYFLSIDRLDLQKEVTDVSVFLELGLNQKTQLSLVGIGLSRTAAVMLSEIISNDNFSEDECANWLLDYDWQSSDFPNLVQVEIKDSLEKFLRKSRFAKTGIY